MPAVKRSQRVVGVDCLITEQTTTWLQQRGIHPPEELKSIVTAVLYSGQWRKEREVAEFDLVLAREPDLTIEIMRFVRKVVKRNLETAAGRVQDFLTRYPTLVRISGKVYCYEDIHKKPALLKTGRARTIAASDATDDEISMLLKVPTESVKKARQKLSR